MLNLGQDFFAQEQYLGAKPWTDGDPHCNSTIEIEAERPLEHLVERLAMRVCLHVCKFHLASYQRVTCDLQASHQAW